MVTTQKTPSKRKVKISNVGSDEKKTSKRKMNRVGSGGEKAASSAKSASKGSSAGMRPSAGGRGGRHRRVDDNMTGFNLDERPGGGSRDNVVDKRCFDGFIDDSDMSDLS